MKLLYRVIEFRFGSEETMNRQLLHSLKADACYDIGPDSVMTIVDHTNLNEESLHEKLEKTSSIKLPGCMTEKQYREMKQKEQEFGNE